MSIDFFAPFVIPIGISLLSAIVDSVSQRGQQLAVHQGVILPFKGIKKVFFHFSQYMHHIYLGCIAFDLAALIPARIEDQYKFFMSSSGQDLTHWIPLVAFAMLFHVAVYVHTVLILREYLRDKNGHRQDLDKVSTRPITYLHLLYLPISVLLLVLVRL